MKRFSGALALAMLLTTFLAAGVSADVDPPIRGAIYTTESDCLTVNANTQYADKEDIYLNGGPQGGNQLAEGTYWVQVTSPGGTILGQSTSATLSIGPDGKSAAGCDQLWLLVESPTTEETGYDDTVNPGGVYIVGVCGNDSFNPNVCKYDAFKVQGSGPPPSNSGTLTALKFYDANANGIRDSGEVEIAGWRVTLFGASAPTIALDVALTPKTWSVLYGAYDVTESTPIETNWLHTTDTTQSATVDSTTPDPTVTFGNVCLGGGGGHTLGFWSNKNGQAQINDGGSSVTELGLLSSLNLRNADGTAFNPATYAPFRTWLLSANATNMAYMLSAQLAAMELNVEAAFVSGSAIVWSPTLDFITVDDLIAAADTSLGANPNTTAAGPARTEQEQLKNALDAANNNLNFVQSVPCTFSFAP